LPLYFTAGVMPLQNTAKQSVLSCPVAGGLADENVKVLTLYRPVTNAVFGGINQDEPTAPIPLQPHSLDFLCDQINVDVLGWANCQPFNCRILVAMDGIEI
jgi:hypothetical protein